MKTAFQCPICKKIRSLSQSYSVKLTTYTTPDGVFLPAGGQQVTIKVCRTCVKRMGYKVKVAKK